MTITKEQIKRIHVHLPKEIVQDPEAKQSFIAGFTEDPLKTSTKQLTFDQANAALIALKAKPFKRPYTKLTRWQMFDHSKKSHLNILSLLIQLDWKWYSTQQSKYFADMVAFGTWLQNHAPVKRSLLDMSPPEVSKTIVALENMVKGKIKKTSQR